MPTSFFVLGAGESAHWISLALMACLRERDFRITALLPFAHDAQWHRGRWRSEQVSRLQAASSFAFPASALCTAPMPEPGRQLVLHPEAVVDSYAALATWADIVVIGSEGGPDAPLAPGVTLGDVVKALALPVILVLEEGGANLSAASHLISLCQNRGFSIAGCVCLGSLPLAAGTNFPHIGAVPVEALHEPAVASGHINGDRLMDVLNWHG